MEQITTETIKKFLNQRYSDTQSGMVAFEVANGTGGDLSRRADAVSFEFWPSKGYALTGYEFKLSRADWLSELWVPEKSHAISQYCDYWYLVAPKGVLKSGELPSGWGYMMVSKKTLLTKISAPKREACALEKCFVASLLRRCVEKYSDKKLVNEIRAEADSRARIYCENVYKNRILSQKKQIDEYANMVEGFEERSGIRLNKWSYRQTATVISMLNNLKDKGKLIEEIKRLIANQEMSLRHSIESLRGIEQWPATEDK